MNINEFVASFKNIKDTTLARSYIDGILGSGSIDQFTKRTITAEDIKGALFRKCGADAKKLDSEMEKLSEQLVLLHEQEKIITNDEGIVTTSSYHEAKIRALRNI